MVVFFIIGTTVKFITLFMNYISEELHKSFINSCSPHFCLFKAKHDNQNEIWER